MKIETFEIGPIRTDCYFLINEDTKELAIVDPALDVEKLFQKVEEEGLKLVAILLTHGHHDHIMGVPGWKERFPDVTIYASKEEADVLWDTQLNLSFRFKQYAVSVKADHLLEDGETFSILGETFQLLHTPGHTKGSSCFYNEKEKVLLSGDTLFTGSMGRTDLPTGSEQEIFRSLKKLSSLPDDVAVLPGHGPASTMITEKQTNPYLKQAML